MERELILAMKRGRGGRKTSSRKLKKKRREEKVREERENDTRHGRIRSTGIHLSPLILEPNILYFRPQGEPLPYTQHRPGTYRFDIPEVCRTLK